jgi:hypothetical protein
MVAILAAISSCRKNPTYQFLLKLEHFEILRILAAILKMAVKLTAINVIVTNAI